jgi:hypothetical protein
VERAVRGLSTLSLETLRWVRSPIAAEINVRPFSRMQNPNSQTRAARLWACLLCYCLRVVAMEEQERERERERERAGGCTEQAAVDPDLYSIAALFPWQGRQKAHAVRLLEYLYLAYGADVLSAQERTVKQRDYVARLSLYLIFQTVDNEQFKSLIIHFLAALY